MASRALVDVVPLAPWGSDILRLVREHAEVFTAVPHAIHEGVLRSYMAGASHVGLTEGSMEMLIWPWRGVEGQAAFCRQIAEADLHYTDEVEPRYAEIDLPVLVVRGQCDAAGVAGGALDSVDRDLDDLFGAHAHDVPVVGDLELAEPLGLPAQGLVRHPLERLTGNPIRHGLARRPSSDHDGVGSRWTGRAVGVRAAARADIQSLLGDAEGV